MVDVVQDERIERAGRRQRLEEKQRQARDVVEDEYGNTVHDTGCQREQCRTRSSETDKCLGMPKRVLTKATAIATS